MHHIDWTLSKKDKILITVTLIAYGIGYLIGGWSPVLNLLFLFFLLGVAQKTMKSGRIATFRLGMLAVITGAMLLIRIGLFSQTYIEYKAPDRVSTASNQPGTSQAPRPTKRLYPTAAPRMVQWDRLNDLKNPTITGSIVAIEKDLDLFKDAGKRNIDYFEAGTFVSGPYEGYKRIIAFDQGVQMGEPRPYFFLTRDFKTYVFVENPTEVDAWPPEDYRNPVSGIVKEKLEGVAEIETDLPDVIEINDTYALYKNKLQTEAVKKEVDSTQIFNSDHVLRTTFAGYTSVPSRGSFLSFYSVPSAPITNTIAHPYTDAEIAMHKNVLYATSGMIVKDATGLAYSYHLSRTKNILKNQYPETFWDSKSGHLFGASYYLTLQSDEIKTNEPLYTKYDVAVPQNCVSSPDPQIIAGMTESRLQELGTTDDGITVYKLKNEEDPLYHLQYISKPPLNREAGNEQIYSNPAGKMVAFPTFGEYLSKTPLLFVKDPWERWMMFGEFDYSMPGGCGKPVVYLYPPTEQRVRLSFQNPVSFDTQIPAYRNGWNVTAYPDGTIRDEQPQYTSCSSPQMSGKGAEYAAKACTENKYPYIYWSGNTTGTYPNITNRGWYVKREDLNGFMDKKLEEIGLNDKEKQDMMEYWMPAMLAKQGSYFRISFLMTEEMNRMIPMRVNPLPDSVLRIFLDFEPYAALPEKKLKPQTFPPFVRNGFTVVEWGGLKK